MGTRYLGGLTVFVGLLLVFSPAPPAAASPPEGEDLSADLREFIENEVRYIISDDEQAEWDRLTTNTEREAFAKKFWAKRDPDPATPINEYRQEHHRRMASCKSLFRGEGRPGWLTDRGRIYVIFGPPDEVRDVGGGGIISRGGSTGRIIWTYRAPDNPYLGPNTRIVFTYTPGGRWVLDSEVNAGAEAAFFSSQLGRTTRDDSIQKGKTLDDIKTQPAEADPSAQLFLDIAAGNLPEGVQPIPLEISFFPVGEPQLYVPVRLQRSWPATEQAMTLRARLYTEDSGSRPIKGLDMEFEAAGADTRSFGFMLDPGSYQLSLACEDGEGKLTAAGSTSFEVPEMSGSEFMASSVLLATSARPRESGVVDMDSIQEGLVLGNFVLDVALGNTVAKGAPHPYLIYLVHGATAADAGALDLTLNYTIKRKADGEVVRKFPEQTRNTSFVAHPLPVTDLEADDYILEMKLGDRRSGQEYSRNVEFRLE